MLSALTSLNYAGKSKRIQNLIQDKRPWKQPNPSNLKTQWYKTRAYVGGYPKCGVRRWMLITSLETPSWILAETLVCTCVILNGPNLSPYNFW